jgi:ankyrin repeat protein
LIGDELLDQACLTYSERDTSERYQKAQRLLAKDPTLSAANIFTAAAVGDVRAAEDFLNRDPQLVKAKGGPRDWEPLLYLCYARLQSPDPEHNPLEVAKLLLASGADPNAFFKFDYGSIFTALTGAFGEGERGPANQPPHYQCAELARLLLDEGADPNDGQALYNRMFRHGPGNECIELLLSYGLKASDKINWQEDPAAGTLDFLLEYAVKKGFASRVILLLENGANPNFSGFYEPKKTPYEHALECEHEQIAAILKKAGGRAPENG